ncbi:cytochrome c oxidase subunit 1 [Striga asiatica]|uniref:Cytochrome c oxidase subunit 1 n=1 Tax=Striga asiatica TaxID=4170 RepID=A0A5A7QRZ9_STRAF|nr:cytochrome c oxidase subunit 1 [Striga asiatica]
MKKRQMTWKVSEQILKHSFASLSFSQTPRSRSFDSFLSPKLLLLTRPQSSSPPKSHSFASLPLSQSHFRSLAVAPIIACTSAPNRPRLLRSGQELTPVLDLSVEGVDLGVGGAAFPCTRFTIKAQQIFVSLSIKMSSQEKMDESTGPIDNAPNEIPT